MPPQPQTPTKADDGIEKLKLSLSTKWGIQWPIRDALWSPSRKDPNRVEDKILACIQYLYFRNDALAYAVEQFEKHVLVLCSGWQFKPHAELDVLPSIEPHKSFLRHEFLRKRDEIPKAAVKELTEILWSTLSQIAERAKAGEIFRKSESGCNVTDSLSVRDICADISRDPKLISTETPSKPDVSTPRQPSLTDGFRSRSELGPSRKTATVTVQHPSSDDSHDEDMLDVFDEIGKMEVSPLPSLGSSSKNDRNSKEGTQIWNQDSPIEEEFKTPPTTPPRRNFENAGLELGMNEHTVGSKDPGAHVFKTTQIAVAPNIKRSFPEPMKPPLPRKGSREMRNHDVPKIVSKVGPLSHEDYTAPTPPPEDVLVPSNPGSSSRSLGILTSVSSMTSASSAWTSPDTSFSAESLATSFNSTVEGTDGKKRRSYDDLSVSKCAHNEYNGVEKTSVDKVWDRLGEGPMVSKEYTTPPDGSMDLDSDSTATYIPTTKYGATNLVAPVTFKPIQTNIGDLLADRLKSYPPFG